jgi:hypothetical protein
LTQTGLGIQLAEEASMDFGRKVEPVSFTGPVKEQLAFDLRRRFGHVTNNIFARLLLYLAFVLKFRRIAFSLSRESEQAFEPLVLLCLDVNGRGFFGDTRFLIEHF